PVGGRGSVPPRPADRRRHHRADRGFLTWTPWEAPTRSPQRAESPSRPLPRPKPEWGSSSRPFRAACNRPGCTLEQAPRSRAAWQLRAVRIRGGGRGRGPIGAGRSKGPSTCLLAAVAAPLTALLDLVLDAPGPAE